MSIEDLRKNKKRLSCLCGESLQLDVLSLNRKLLGDHSKKLYKA
jgi:hypothetical protein